MSNAIYPTLKQKAVLISGGASGMGEVIVEASPQSAPVGFGNLSEDAGAALASERQGQSACNR